MCEFTKMYGNTIMMRALEYCLERVDLDFAVGDMAAELKVSRPSAYAIVDLFCSKGYLRKSRLVAGTQLFILDKHNPLVKIHLRNLQECVDGVVAEALAR